MRGKASTVVLAIIGVAAMALSVAFRMKGDDDHAWERVIAGDGVGYNTYLSSLLIHGTLCPPAAQPDHLTPAGHGHVIKYTLGTSLMQAPFYLLAHARTLWSNKHEDGRSLHYQAAIALAAWTYLMLGLLMTRRLLQQLNMSDLVAAFVLLLLFFGTGLCWYGVMEPSMSHVYSFTAIAWFLASVQRAGSAPRMRSLVVVALSLGLVILVRPVNVVVVLAVPLVFTVPQKAALALWRPVNISRLLLPALTCALMLFLQPLLWHLQSVSWWVRPYAGEGFLWDHPMVWKSLFGAQKGLFFYWPLLLLIIPAPVLLLHDDRFRGIAALCWLALLVYVTSAWWNWAYADSYGLRAYLDHSAVFAVLIGITVQWSIARLGRWPLLFCFPLMALQCFQAWQYHAGILQQQSMSWEKYRYIFLRSASGYRRSLGGCLEPAPYAPHGMRTFCRSSCDPQAHQAEWSSVPWGSLGKKGFFCRLDSMHRTSVAFTCTPDRYPHNAPVFVEMVNTRLETKAGASGLARVVCVITYANGSKANVVYPLNDVPDPPAGLLRSWRSSFCIPAAPEVRSLELSVFQPSSGTFWMAPPEVMLSTPN